MSGFVDVLRASYDAVDLPDVASPSVFILLIFGSMREQMIRSKVQVRAIDATSREEQRCPCRWHGGGDSRIHRSGRGCRERMVGASGFTTGLVTFYDASLAAWFLRFADYTSTSDDGGGCAGQRRANKVTQLSFNTPMSARRCNVLACRSCVSTAQATGCCRECSSCHCIRGAFDRSERLGVGASPPAKAGLIKHAGREGGRKSEKQCVQEECAKEMQPLGKAARKAISRRPLFSVRPKRV